MHQVLRLEELVRNISNSAEPTSQGSASLLAFACCCKSLEGPVMDALWQRQADLSTILKSLPADSWTITEDVFFLSRNLSPDEWQRFKRYTARVTALGVPNMHSLLSPASAGISTDTIQLLAMESQRGGFWPRLSQLKCDTDWSIVPFFSFLLTPTIADLDLTLPQEDNRLLQPALSLITHTCRQLQALRLDVNTYCPLSGREIGRLISASRNTLRRIDIRPLAPAEIFPAIFDLPQLRCLVLQQPRFPNQTLPKISSRLEFIYLSDKLGSNLCLFLGQLSFQECAKVSIVGSEIVQLYPLLNSLRGAATTLATLYLSPTATLERSSVILLCSFINLTSLKIRCVCAHPLTIIPCNFQPTDEDIIEIGKCLPLLQTLNLGSGCRTPRLATFASLLSLSRTCSHLRMLITRVDFVGIVGGSDQSNHLSLRASDACLPRTRSGLNTLNVGNSVLPDTPHCEWVVALALVSIFPSIKFLHFSSTMEMNVRWVQVQRDILACQRIMDITQAAAVFKTIDRFP
ncbi:hypothetical protein BJ322DRAFT_464586 [Thelephora terrestris]|uniref:F-box domain-containing protein n=1 Tax=Thelephora terrestris TaxID=56493 RepID=A0A9P6L1S8_9AGAM|nr:hypothetical protein BJ322DRAFT_464586 [Thelephora terrestris]